ncbi:MAG: SAM hydrolase/SAM-dependent halogenase family protein [Leptospirillia bacterium]
MNRLVTFTSDFGRQDSYVASVKTRILAGAPETMIVDVTHDVRAFTPVLALPPLIEIMQVAPPGTIHLVVVDPGVGSERRALAGEGRGYFFVLPDNGLPARLSEWFDEIRFYHLDHPELFGGRATATFQGRDLFAPAVAALATGKATPQELGPLVPTGSLLPEEGLGPAEADRLLIWNTDRFGNLLLEFFATLPPEDVRVVHRGRRIPYVSRYQEVARGELGCLINSTGWLEIFCREGDASKKTGLGVMDRVAGEIEGGSGRKLRFSGREDSPTQ